MGLRRGFPRGTRFPRRCASVIAAHSDYLSLSLGNFLGGSQVYQPDDAQAGTVPMITRRCG